MSFRLRSVKSWGFESSRFTKPVTSRSLHDQVMQPSCLGHFSDRRCNHRFRPYKLTFIPTCPSHQRVPGTGGIQASQPRLSPHPEPSQTPAHCRVSTNRVLKDKAAITTRKEGHEMEAQENISTFVWPRRHEFLLLEEISWRWGSLSKCHAHLGRAAFPAVGSFPFASLPVHPQPELRCFPSLWLSRPIRTFLKETASFAPKQEAMQGQLDFPIILLTSSVSATQASMSSHNVFPLSPSATRKAEKSDCWVPQTPLANGRIVAE